MQLKFLLVLHYQFQGCHFRKYQSFRSKGWQKKHYFLLFSRYYQSLSFPKFLLLSKHFRHFEGSKPVSKEKQVKDEESQLSIFKCRVSQRDMKVKPNNGMRSLAFLQSPAQSGSDQDSSNEMSGQGINNNKELEPQSSSHQDDCEIFDADREIEMSTNNKLSNILHITILHSMIVNFNWLFTYNYFF